MNQDYWRDLASMYEGWDNLIKISVLVLTVLAFSLSLIELRTRPKTGNQPTPNSPSRWWAKYLELKKYWNNSLLGKIPLSAKFSLLSVMAAIVLNTISFGANAQQSHLLFQQWTMLRGEIIDLELTYKTTGRGGDVAQVDEQYTQLLKMITNRISRVESQEPAAITDRLQAAYDREAMRQGLDPNWDKKERKPDPPDDTASLLPETPLR